LQGLRRSPKDINILSMFLGHFHRSLDDVERHSQREREAGPASKERLARRERFELPAFWFVASTAQRLELALNVQRS